ncbi:hypothetical protein NL526_28285, partial [Klebsiella pneumoniae]|nr:hypothetical protein [Klebsiella pneumoniae]
SSRAPAAIRWQSGQVVLDPWRLDGPNGVVTASGTFSGGTAGLSLALDGVRLPGALASIGAGRARAEFHVDAAGVDVTRASADWPGIAA